MHSFTDYKLQNFNIQFDIGSGSKRRTVSPSPFKKPSSSCKCAFQLKF